MPSLARFVRFLSVLISVSVPVATYAQSPLPWLHQEGMFWRDDQGHKVDLKGANLGNWLILEMWMTSLFEGIHDQCGLESALSTRFGYAGKESIMRTWRDHWITERDLDLCQAFGLNCIRVPFLYSIIEDENNPYTVRPGAWDHLDWVIDEAEARGMYTILDLHGAVGGQSDMDHTGCANQNLLWSTPAYQDRTVWLWQQIAARYHDRSAVVAYDLLNEAWGTDCWTMAQFQIDLYHAVRAVDANHCIILSAAISCGGIDMYGDPQDDHGMFNVAFTHHFYPGFFGQGDPTLDTHADWLACRAGRSSGVCAWHNKMANTGTAFLVGELQPWATMGDIGGELARHTLDRYADLGMASTVWAYKVLTPDGGQGDGTWGMVTNVGGQPMVSAGTWTCPGWDSSFADACGAHTVHYTAPGTGPATLYVVLKNGALSANTFDVVWDEISLVHDTTGQELLTNGGFGSAAGWSEYHHEHPVNHDYAHTGLRPTGAVGPALRMYGTAPAAHIANGGVYQAVTVTGGESYTLHGVFRDIGSSATWAEVYLGAAPPVDGQDLLNPDRLPSIDIDTWTQPQIESYLQTLSTMEYDIHDDLMYWLTTAEEPCLIAELCEGPGQPFYEGPQAIPGRIEAEDFDLGGEGDAYHDCDAGNNGGAYRPGEGVDIEVCSAGGYNVGWLCPGEWIDYTVDVAFPGIYDVELRVASQTSGGTCHIEFEDVDETGLIAVPATGGWQAWTTVTATALLSAGPQKMRFVHAGAAGAEYNVNDFNFVLQPPSGDLDADTDVDVDDLAGLAACMAGPGVAPDPSAPPTSARCRTAFDFDTDNDVDVRDLAAFQRVFTGPM